MIDTIPCTRSEAENIAREVMMAEIKPLVFELEQLKEELRQLNEGERIVVPKDKEHAEAMFKLASMYLGFWKPGEEFKFK